MSETDNVWRFQGSWNEWHENKGFHTGFNIFILRETSSSYMPSSTQRGHLFRFSIIFSEYFTTQKTSSTLCHHCFAVVTISVSIFDVVAAIPATQFFVTRDKVNRSSTLLFCFVFMCFKMSESTLDSSTTLVYHRLLRTTPVIFNPSTTGFDFRLQLGMSVQCLLLLSDIIISTQQYLIKC